jgi:hypothetical protein
MNLRRITGGFTDFCRWWEGYWNWQGEIIESFQPPGTIANLKLQILDCFISFILSVYFMFVSYSLSLSMHCVFIDVHKVGPSIPDGPLVNTKCGGSLPKVLNIIFFFFFFFFFFVCNLCFSICS